MPVTEIKTVTELRERIRGDRPAIIHFRSGGSGRSRRMEPILEELCREHPDFDFFNINVDEVKGLENVAEVGEVDQTPTFMVFKQGKLTDKAIQPDARHLKHFFKELPASISPRSIPSPPSPPPTRNIITTPRSAVGMLREKIDTGRPVVVYFLAAWSPACRHLSAIFDRLSEFTDHVDFHKIDVEEGSEPMHEFGIREIPTFVLFEHGEKIREIVGPKVTEYSLQHFIRELRV